MTDAWTVAMNTKRAKKEYKYVEKQGEKGEEERK